MGWLSDFTTYECEGSLLHMGFTYYYIIPHGCRKYQGTKPILTYFNETINIDNTVIGK